MVSSYSGYQDRGGGGGGGRGGGDIPVPRPSVYHPGCSSLLAPSHELSR